MLDDFLHPLPSPRHNFHPANLHRSRSCTPHLKVHYLSSQVWELFRIVLKKTGIYNMIKRATRYIVHWICITLEMKYTLFNLR